MLGLRTDVGRVEEEEEEAENGGGGGGGAWLCFMMPWKVWLGWVGGDEDDGWAA